MRLLPWPAQSSDLNLIENDLTRRPESADSGASVLETQVKILESDKVLSRAVAALHLAEDPAFSRRPFWRDGGLLESVFVTLGAATPAGDESRARSALDRLRGMVTVRRTERTFVIDVSARTPAPELSADIANAVAEAYLAERSTMRSDAAARASANFSANLDPLRAAVNRAADTVVAFKTRHRLIGGAAGPVTDQQIGEATAALGRAREAAAQALTRSRQMRGARGDVGQDSLPDVVQSPELRDLRLNLAALLRQQAELGGHLGPRFPDMIDLAAKIAQARRAIDAQVKSLVASTRKDYERAAAAETSLTAELDRLRGEGGDDASANVTLRQLQDDLDARRSVYESYLKRASETGEQGRIDATNAQVIGAAEVPRKRSFPPSPLLLLPGGLLMGIGVGLGLSLLLRRETPRWLTPVGEPRFAFKDEPMPRRSGQPGERC